MYFTLVIVAIISLLWLYKRWPRKPLPLSHIPCPKGVMILGNAPQLSDGPIVHLKLTEWADELGPMYRINLVGMEFLVISGYKEIQEVLVTKGKEFSGRSAIFRTRYLMEDFSDMLTVDFGPVYILRRKLLQQHLKQYGEGLGHIEDVTHSVFDEMMADLATLNGAATDIKDIMQQALTEITYVLAFGQRIPNEVEKQDIIQVGQYMVDTLSSVSFLDSFPWLRFFGNEIYKKLYDMRILRRKLSDAWRVKAENEGERNLIWRILKKMEEKKTTPADENDQVYFKERTFDLLTWNLFFGGVATTLATLSSMMNILTHYPDVQKKIQEEIDEKLGKDTPVRFHHRNVLPYSFAAVLELARFTSVLPTSIPHRAMVDTSIQGHQIPKGTKIFINLWGLLHNPEIWGDPFVFRPDRFIQEDNGEILPADHPLRATLMPFGAGPRVCLGEMFAKTRMFVVLCTMLQKFNVLPETTREQQPSCDPREMKLGAVLYPPEFKVRFVTRQ